MKCEEFARMMENYENLTDSERSLMDEHATNCMECRRELDLTRSIINVTRNLPEMTVPEDFLDKLNRRIDAEERPKRGGFGYHIRHNWQKYSATAACLLLAVVIGANYSSIIDNMRGNDDGVISRAVSTSAPAEPRTPKAPAAPTAAPLDDGAVVGNISDRIGAPEPEDSEGARENGAARSPKTDNSENAEKRAESGVGSSWTPPVQPAQAARRETPRNQTAPNVSVASDDQAIPEASAAAPAEKNAPTAPVTQAPEIEANAPVPEDNGDDYGIAVASAEGGDIIARTRGVYVEGEPLATETPDDGNDDESTYSVNSSSKRPKYAIATGEDGVDESGESRFGNGASGYEINTGNLLAVPEEDYSAALDIVSRYLSGSADGYLIVSSVDIDRMLNALSAAGIDYNECISVDSESVTFRLVSQ